MYNEVLDRIITILEEAAQAHPGSVTGDSVLSTLDGWDSMGVVFFLGEVEVYWPAIRVAVAQVDEARTVADLARIVSESL